MHRVSDDAKLFCKHRLGRVRAACDEWRILQDLAALGLPVPAPVFRARSGRQTVVGMRGLSGRPIDALLAERALAPWILDAAAAMLRRLHEGGWVFRDMYWNHVLADQATQRLGLVDVERAFRPRWRVRRWVVKDLAGLLSSVPAGASVRRTDALRFLTAYLGGRTAGWRELARAVQAKADRIRGHRPRYPG